MDKEEELNGVKKTYRKESQSGRDEEKLEERRNQPGNQVTKFGNIRNTVRNIEHSEKIEEENIRKEDGNALYLSVKKTKESAYLLDQGPGAVPRSSSSPSSTRTRSRSAAPSSPPRSRAGGTSLVTLGSLLGAQGASGGTGAMFKGLTNGTLFKNEWDCAATCSGTFVPHGRVRRLTGVAIRDQLTNRETAVMPNLRNGPGLATPGAMLTAPSQGSLTSTNFPH